MRKLLLAGAALLSVGAYASAAKADMDVKLGGYSEFRYGFFDESRNIAGRTRTTSDMETETGVSVMADGKGKNGLEYGALVAMNNDTGYQDSFNGNGANMRFRNSYVYFSGSWGKAILGDEDGASNLFVYAPTIGFDQIDGDYLDFVSGSSTFAFSPTFIDNEEDSTKITYYTPRVAGLQLGGSYMTNYYDQGQNAVKFRQIGVTNGTNSAYRNMFELAAQYKGDIQNVGVVASGLVTTADGNRFYLANANDYTSWALGAQLSYAGFTLGGSYTDPGDFNTVTGENLDQYAWTVGAKYEFGAAAVALNYIDAEGYTSAAATSAGAPRFADDFQAIGAGATYSFAPGLTTAVDFVAFEEDLKGAGLDNDGYVFIVGQKVAF